MEKMGYTLVKGFSQYKHLRKKIKKIIIQQKIKQI